MSVNKESDAWNDVCDMLQHKLLETFTCMQCQHKSEKVLESQLFHTVELPPKKSKLKETSKVVSMRVRTFLKKGGKTMEMAALVQQEEYIL